MCIRDSFIDSMVDVEVEYTFRYIEVLKSLGREVPEIGRELCHMIADGMFEGVCHRKECRSVLSGVQHSKQ